MAGVTTTALLDVLSTGLAKLPQGEFEVALQYQQYPIVDQWFRRHKRRVASGHSISMRVQLQTNGSARHVLLYEPTPNNQVDTMSEISAGWVHAEAKLHFEAHELDMNREPSKLIDLMKERRVAAFLDLADEIETRAWTTPPTAASTKFPLGVPYWINFLNTGTTDLTGSFSGQTAIFGDSATTTNVGGIDGSVAAFARWRNFAANHLGMNMDTMDTIRRAIRRVGFTPPVTIRDLYRGAASQLRLYSSQDYADEYERMVNAGPDNRNGDLNPFGGILTFKRIPWIGVPALDSVSHNPIYGLNHAYFFPYVLRDWWLKEDEPIRDRSQRHVFTVGIDCSYQFFCLNRRAGGFVLHSSF